MYKWSICLSPTQSILQMYSISTRVIHKDVALGYDAIIDDYAKHKQRRMTLIYQSPAINFLMIGLKVMSLGWISFVGLFFYKFSLNLCSKPTFLVANDQSSQNACNKYLSQTNWIWQFFRETMLLQEVVLLKQSLRPLLASLSVNYFFDHNHTCGLLNISAWYLGIDLLNLSYSENFNLKNFPEEHSPETPQKSVLFAVLMGDIVPILPVYTVSLGPLYHKILYPPLKMVYQ